MYIAPELNGVHFWCFQRTDGQVPHEGGWWAEYSPGEWKISSVSIAAESEVAHAPSDTYHWKRVGYRKDGRTRTQKRPIIQGPPQSYKDSRVAARGKNGYIKKYHA